MSKIRYVISGLIGGIIIPLFTSYQLDLDLRKEIPIAIVFGFILQFIVSRKDFGNKVEKISLYWTFFVLGFIIGLIAFFLLLANGFSGIG